MRAGDAMTLHPVAVDPESSVADAVRIMLDKRISGLFVVDAKGDLRGIVTEGDLLRREELGTQRHRPWWLRAFVSPAKQAQDFTRSHGRRVRDVMTERVVSVPEDAALDEVVAAMEAHRIKRVGNVTHFFRKTRHFGNATGIVGDRAERIKRDNHTGEAEHGCHCNRGTEKTSKLECCDNATNDHKCRKRG